MRWIGRQRTKAAWCCDRCRMAAQKDLPLEPVTTAPSRREEVGITQPSEASLSLA